MTDLSLLGSRAGNPCAKGSLDTSSPRSGEQNGKEYLLSCPNRSEGNIIFTSYDGEAKKMYRSTCSIFLLHFFLGQGILGGG